MALSENVPLGRTLTVRWIPWTIGLLLVGTFLLKLRLPLILGLGLASALFLVWTVRLSLMDRIGVTVLVTYLYCLMSGLILGGIEAGALISRIFYETDGRIFLSYLPLLLFSVIRIERNDVQITLRVLIGIAVAILALLFLWRLTDLSFLSGGRAGNFFGFLTSHTGAGMFFGMIAIFLTVYGLCARRYAWFILGLSIILAVAGAASRQTLLAAFIVLSAYLVRYARPRILVLSVVCVVLLGWTMYFTFPHMYQRSKTIFSPQLYQDMVNTYRVADWSPGSEKELEGHEVNILSRMLHWSYAIDRFSDSPVLGMGFARFNDHRPRMYGVRGLGYFAVSAGDNVYSKANAHNSYLNILSEIGVVGMGLVLAIWIALFRRFKTAAAQFPEGSEMRAYFLACRAIILFVLIGSLTGHALVSSAHCIPVLTILGVGLSYYRQFCGDLPDHSADLPMVTKGELIGARP